MSEAQRQSTVSNLPYAEYVKHMFSKLAAKTVSNTDVVGSGFVELNHGRAGQEMITDKDILALDDLHNND